MTNNAIPASVQDHQSWRDYLEIHPACLQYPELGKDELAELAADIKAHGLEHDIVLFMRDGRQSLLDGRSRLDALELAGFVLIKNGWVDFTFGLNGKRRVRVASSCNPFKLAATLNAHRRHLTPKQKRERTKALLKANPEKSNRQIAKVAKVDHKTVGTIRAEKVATGEIPQLKKTVGADGKTRKQPATRPSPSHREHPPIEVPAEDITPPPVCAHETEARRLLDKAVAAIGLVAVIKELLFGAPEDQRREIARIVMREIGKDMA
jgi:hypothetical protein